MDGFRSVFVLPAALAAALALCAAPAAASGLPGHVTAAQGHRGAAHHHRLHHHWNGLVHLPALPTLIEEAGPRNWSAQAYYRPAGIPDAVGHVPAAGPYYSSAAGHAASVFYGGYGLPSWIPGSGTYAGNIQAVQMPGVGNYFAVYGTAGTADHSPVLTPSPKIIHIDSKASDAACQMEAGVCVIRP